MNTLPLPFPEDSAQPSRSILSVSELTTNIRGTLQGQFGSIWVSGEVTDLTRPASGHLYFTLKDETARLRCIIWRSTVAKLKQPLDDGMEVICGGSVNVYDRHGTYQLIVRKVEAVGEGKRQGELKQLQQKLAQEGLFDSQHKQPLPRFPRRIAVVTSPTSAAIRDFLEVARRRWQGVHILVIPATVQGASAVGDVVRGIETANQLAPAPEVLVITRGGGSLEDLQAFNDERVVRAAFASHIPCVSAIGHEIDVTLCDLVADRRALTPSEAAELAVPDGEAWLRFLQQTNQRIQHALRSRVQYARQRWESCARHSAMLRPLDRIRDQERRLDDLLEKSIRSTRRHLEAASRRVGVAAASLEALSPLNVLARGYAVVTTDPERTVVHSIQDVTEETIIYTEVSDGVIESRVTSTSPSQREV